jgi:hypothetical protein
MEAHFSVTKTARPEVTLLESYGKYMLRGSLTIWILLQEFSNINIIRMCAILVIHVQICNLSSIRKN